MPLRAYHPIGANKLTIADDLNHLIRTGGAGSFQFVTSTVGFTEAPGRSQANVQRPITLCGFKTA